MTSTSNAGHAVLDGDGWLAAQRAHLVREKELTRLRDAVSAERRALPWLEVTAPYAFDGPAGAEAAATRTLADLFDGRSQLLVYHFMYGPDWGVEGCPSCSFWADNFDGIQVHLAHRDTSLVAVSRASVEQIAGYRRRIGWGFDWYSSARSDFNFDMRVSFRPEELAGGEARYNLGTQETGMDEAPGISAFRRTDDGRIFLTYQTFSRGLDLVNGAYHWLDLTSKGRDEDGLQWSMAWLRRHDAYED
ncbi:MAG: DUF899 family protein [Chloroflexi bacterium]|nr:DUF899 family protein [Chloroflexota bacterium]MDA1147413.1 DUF899 family protein [Chloroflexota bacterium]